MSQTKWQPSASLDNIKLRARMLNNIRAFFAERNVLEVDTPVLSPAAITDPQLESFKTQFNGRDCYLHTSPEFYMKRLLAAGSGDIYQLAKVFRLDEQGRNHNPEFTLLEWYRCGLDHHQLMDEIETLLNLLWDEPVEVERISYQQAFKRELEIDPLQSTASELQLCAVHHQVDIPRGMDETDKDMWLDWLMIEKIAPSFAKKRFTFLYDYPASQAALARLNSQDPGAAHRFELFYGELELANGFNELTDASEQRKRFQQENILRKKRKQAIMPVDENLLNALEAGLPDCSGVAIGIDRLLMLLSESEHIRDVISFAGEL